MLTEQADHCFEGGQFEQAAEIYAQTNKSFEEVSRVLSRVLWRALDPQAPYGVCQW